MSSYGLTLFETPIGWCGVAWGPNGIVGSSLPGADVKQTRAYLRRRFPEAREDAAPPPEVQRGIDGIVALLSGDPDDLQDVVLDMSGVPDFDQQVYEIARTIPPGQTLTYGEIARR